MFYFPNIHLAIPGRLSRHPEALLAASAHGMGGAGPKADGFEGFAESFYQLVKPICEVAASLYQLAGTRNELAGRRNELVGTRNELAGTRNELAGTRNELAGTRCQALILTGGRLVSPGSTATLTGGNAYGPVE